MSEEQTARWSRRLVGFTSTEGRGAADSRRMRPTSCTSSALSRVPTVTDLFTTTTIMTISYLLKIILLNLTFFTFSLYKSLQIMIDTISSSCDSINILHCSICANFVISKSFYVGMNQHYRQSFTYSKLKKNLAFGL